MNEEKYPEVGMPTVLRKGISFIVDGSMTLYPGFAAGG